MPVFQSQLLAHMQKAGSCDLMLNKWALGNGRAWQQGCREGGFSNMPKVIPCFGRLLSSLRLDLCTL